MAQCTIKLLLAVALVATSAAFAQSPPVPQWQTAAGGTMEFDVASVKPSKPGTPYGSNVSLDGLDGPPPGDLFVANAPLHAYLLFAYKISDSNQARAIYDKLPAWAKAPQFFNIEARADGTPTRDQLRLMMQALLAERFKLAIHRETHPEKEYTFSLYKPNKPGPQLQPHPADKPCVKNPSSAQVIAAPANEAEAPRYCGMVTWRKDGQQHIRIIDMTIAEMVSYVAGLSGTWTPHSGVDATGLTGKFDLDIHFVPEMNPAGSNPDADGPTFSEALKNQLGIKLVEQMRPMEILVIDHLERPSEN